MSYYETQIRTLKLDNDIVIDGVTWPETDIPIQVKPQFVTDGGRLADNIDYEGSSLGVKHTISIHYDWLNKSMFDKVYAIMKKYENNPNADMFFNIKVPTHTSNGVKTFKVYLGASSFSNWSCTATTEYMGGTYGRNGSNYDELHEDINIEFIEK